jgi:hypothetical protein
LSDQTNLLLCSPEEATSTRKAKNKRFSILGYTAAECCRRYRGRDTKEDKDGGKKTLHDDHKQERISEGWKCGGDTKERKM